MRADPTCATRLLPLTAILSVALAAATPRAAVSAEPRWAAIPDVCGKLRAEGWGAAGVTGPGSGAEATVGGSVKIRLCRVSRALPGGGTPAPSLEVFMQYRGGHNASLTASYWRDADRATTLSAAADVAARLARDLGLELPPPAAAAIRAADEYEDTLGGIVTRVSRTTRQSELVSQPDLKPETVPLLAVTVSFSPAD